MPEGGALTAHHDEFRIEGIDEVRQVQSEQFARCPEDAPGVGVALLASAVRASMVRPVRSGCS